MTPEEFEDLAQEFATLNVLSISESRDILARIGDRPEFLMPSNPEDARITHPTDATRTLLWPD
jgi:hypothetical protein